MKRILIVSCVIMFSVGAYAQSDTTYKRINKDVDNYPEQKSKTNTQVTKTIPDGVMMKGNKALLIKNGEIESMDKEVMLSDGSKVTLDGTIVKPNGTRVRLTDGQYVDMSGKMIDKEQNKNLYLVPDSTHK